MFCLKCGKEVDEGTKFCPGCGEALGQADPKVTESNNITGGNVNGSSLLKGLTTTQIVGFAGFLLIIIGTFLPMYKVDLFGFKETTTIGAGWGAFLIILALAGAALILIKKGLYAIAPLILCLIIWFSRMFAHGDTYGVVKMAFGFYVILIGVLVGAVFAFLTLKEKKIIK